MKIGILVAGAPPANLPDQFESYAQMVATLLGSAFSVRSYDVRAGVLPAHAEECEAWLITGSSSGVYDPDVWIAELKAFLQQASGRVPMVGICFGHQLMAKAFGGHVIKSPKGWGIGLHRYGISQPAEWMGAETADVHLPVSHQDQVVAVGPSGEVLGGSDFTPFAMLAYSDRRAFSIQAHPEYDPQYVLALIEHRRGTRFSKQLADAATASLAATNDRDRVAGWLRRFLTTQ